MKCPSCQTDNNYPANTCSNCGLSLKEAKKELVVEKLAMVENAPDDPDLLSELGWAYFLDGKKNQAIESLEKAIQLNENLPNLYPYIVLSDIYEFSDKYDKSYQVLANGLVEKLDKFRGNTEINGLEIVDKALRKRYIEFRVWAYGRIRTNAGNAARRGMDKAARDAGYPDFPNMIEAQTNDAGTYELAKRLSKKERVPNKIRRLRNLFILLSIILTLAIGILSSDFSTGCISGVILAALIVGIYNYRETIMKFIKEKMG